MDYDCGGTALKGLYARPEGEGLPDRIPGVILAHTAVGPQEGVAARDCQWPKSVNLKDAVLCTSLTSRMHVSASQG